MLATTKNTIYRWLPGFGGFKDNPLEVRENTYLFAKMLACVESLCNVAIREGSLVSASVADPDPGSGAAGSGIGFSGSLISDSGYQNPYF
jgi:hypothetical protein